MKLCEMSMSFYLNACIQLGLICFYLRARMRAVRARMRAVFQVSNCVSA
jgi:hypothetical protein